MNRTTSKWRIAAFASLAALVTGVMAQPAPPQEPLSSQRPPGFDPAPLPNITQQPRPGSQAKLQPPPPGEGLTFMNSTSQSAWVTVYGGNDIDSGFCVPPGMEVQWKASDPNAPGRIRAALTRGPQCTQGVVCDTSLAKAPAMTAFEIAGPQCRLLAKRRDLKKESPGDRLSVHNPTKYSVWITLYMPSLTGRAIVGTKCIPPVNSVWWSVPAPFWGERLRWVRAEITGRPNCGPVSKPPCDTTITAAWSGSNDANIALYPKNWAPGGGCWWQWGT